MGAWGPAIFSDDTARDVKDAYRELIEDGYDGSEATRLLMQRFQDYYLDDPVFWLALAATQWQLGRLEDDVKNRAIEVIDTGAGLDVWEDAGEKALNARKLALSKLRDKLLTPQPPPKKLKKPWRYVTDLSHGDAISYRLDSGKFVILRIVGIISNRYICEPIFETCDWIGDTIPSAKQIQRLPYIIQEGSLSDTSVEAISPHKKGAYPDDKIEIVARRLRVRRVTETECYSFCSWIAADSYLNHIADRLSTNLPGLFPKKNRFLEMG